MDDWHEERTSLVVMSFKEMVSDLDYSASIFSIMCWQKLQ